MEEINNKINEIIKASYPNNYEAAAFSEGFKEGVKWFQNTETDIKVGFISDLESGIFDVVEIWNLSDEEFIEKAKKFGYICSLIEFQSTWNHGDVCNGYIRFIK